MEEGMNDLQENAVLNLQCSLWNVSIVTPDFKTCWLDINEFSSNHV